MSCTTIIAVYPNDRTECVEELRNSWGSAPFVWAALASRWLNVPSGGFFAILDKVWAIRERLDVPVYQRAALMMTFDRCYVAKSDYLRAAKDIRQFLADFPPQAGRVNHWSRLADLFESNPDYPGIGLWCTSVASNPFQGKWNESKEEHDPLDWDNVYDLYSNLPGQEAACPSK